MKKFWNIQFNGKSDNKGGNMKKKDNESSPKTVNYIFDTLGIVILVYILECVGCDVCRNVGRMAGEISNGFQDTTHSIRPSELR